MSTETAAEHTGGSGGSGGRPGTGPGTGNDGGASLGYLAGIGTVFRLETKQRLRTRGWYVLLGVWFIVTGLVAALAAHVAGTSTEDAMGGMGAAGQTMFELVIAFVLLFGMLVAPALSANTVTGDRAAGTLAILQNTLLAPGQILAGKWLAAWVSSLAFLAVSLPWIIWAMTYGDIYLPAVPVFLLMTGIELGIICAIGVGVSARSGRPLFAVVATYLLVALLGLGTAIAYGLSYQLVEEKVQVSEQVWPDDPWSNVRYDDEGRALDDNGKVIKDQDAYFAELDKKSEGYVYDPNKFVCGPATHESNIYHTERITWLLAANPFVVMADAVPARPVADDQFDVGVMRSLSDGVRHSQAGLPGQAPCLGGVKQDIPPQGAGTAPDAAPLWPLGLGVQIVLAGALLLLGRRRLSSPAGPLPRGTRLA